ncbi:MAG: orotidine 5'-phosphate decarboxylase / HUMPS family protein, partial [Acetobacteraceae bacterium]
MSTRIRHLTRANLCRGMVQVSLDLKTVDDALRMASVAVAAGADWLEIGTPLALSQGTTAVRELRNAFPGHPLVADLNIMDGGYCEAALYADAGAD